MPGAPRRATSRCAYAAAGRRCRRVGFGDPPLCRAHALAVQLEMEANDPMGRLFEAADRWLSRQPMLRDIGAGLGEALNTKTGGMLRERVVQLETQLQQARMREAQQRGQNGPKRAKQPSRRVDPRQILCFPPDIPLSRDQVKERRKQLAALVHPDKPLGSEAAMKRINLAADALLAKLA